MLFHPLNGATGVIGESQDNEIPFCQATEIAIGTSVRFHVTHRFKYAKKI